VGLFCGYGVAMLRGCVIIKSLAKKPEQKDGKLQRG